MRASTPTHTASTKAHTDPPTTASDPGFAVPVSLSKVRRANPGGYLQKVNLGKLTGRLVIDSERANVPIQIFRGDKHVFWTKHRDVCTRFDRYVESS